MKPNFVKMSPQNFAFSTFHNTNIVAFVKMFQFPIGQNFASNYLHYMVSILTQPKVCRKFFGIMDT